MLAMVPIMASRPAAVSLALALALAACARAGPSSSAPAPIPMRCDTPTSCVVPLGDAWPRQKPLFAPSWAMHASTVVMPCNAGEDDGGWSNESYFGRFGIVDFDWSNAKAYWSKAKPMDCQERLVTQAKRAKAKHPEVTVSAPHAARTTRAGRMCRMYLTALMQTLTECAGAVAIVSAGLGVPQSRQGLALVFGCARQDQRPGLLWVVPAHGPRPGQWLLPRL